MVIDEIGQVGEVLAAIGGVDHQQVLVVGHLVDQGVVDEGALGVHQTGVLGAADGHLRVVVARNQLYEVECAGAANHDLAHVRNVEEPGPVPYRLVFLGQARILDRELETRELHHPTAGRQVLVVKRRSLDPIGLAHGPSILPQAHAAE